MERWDSPGVPVSVLSWWQLFSDQEFKDYDSALRGDLVPWDPWVGKKVGQPISRRTYEDVVDFLRRVGARRKRVFGTRPRWKLDFTVQPNTSWHLAWLPPRSCGKASAGFNGSYWVEEGEQVSLGIEPPRWFRVKYLPGGFALVVEVGGPDSSEPGTPNILVPGEGSLEWPDLDSEKFRFWSRVRKGVKK